VRLPLTKLKPLHVNDKEKRLSPLDVPQKVMAHPFIFVRTLNQTGDVCHAHSRVVRILHHTHLHV
jgi:hypothetical protein